MKKEISYILIFLIVGGFVGYFVSQGSVPVSEKISLNVLRYGEPGDWWGILAGRYEEIHPNVDVELVNTPFVDLKEKQVVALMAGEKLDMVYWATEWMPEYIAAGWVVPLEDYITEYELATLKRNYTPGVLDANTYGGKLYGLGDAWSFAFYYNKKMLDDAGIEAPPTTWEEWESQCQTIMDMGLSEHPTIVGFPNDEMANCTMTVMIHTFGGRWYADNGEPVWHTDPKSIEAVEFLCDAYAKGYISPVSIETVFPIFDQWVSGEFAFAIGWHQAWTFSNDPETSLIAGDSYTAPMPYAPGGESAIVIGSMAYAITTTCENPRLAADFILWNYNESNWMEYAISGVGLECHWVPLAASEELLEFMPEIGKAAEYGKISYPTPGSGVMLWYSDWYIPATAEWQRALTGAKPARDALNAAADLWWELREEYPDWELSPGLT